MTAFGHVERVVADHALGATGYVRTVAGNNEEKAHQAGRRGLGASGTGLILGPEVFGII
jgi:hypothetical protein